MNNSGILNILVIQLFHTTKKMRSILKASEVFSDWEVPPISKLTATLHFGKSPCRALLRARWGRLRCLPKLLLSLRYCSCLRHLQFWLVLFWCLWTLTNTVLYYLQVYFLTHYKIDFLCCVCADSNQGQCIFYKVFSLHQSNMLSYHGVVLIIALLLICACVQCAISLPGLCMRMCLNG